MSPTKEKNRFEDAKKKDMIKYMNAAKRDFNDAKSKKTLDRLKIDLIKMYFPIKNDPSLMAFNEPRITLLKRVNLNLQFLHRLQEVKNQMGQLNVSGAYDEILATSRSVRDHPERAYLYDWIKDEIRETLSFVADRSIEQEEKKKQKQALKLKQKMAQTLRQAASN